MSWQEVPRAIGVYEVSGADNGVYVASLAEAIEVAADWWPDAPSQLDRDILARAASRGREYVNEYLDEAGWDVRIHLVGDDVD